MNLCMTTCISSCNISTNQGKVKHIMLYSNIQYGQLKSLCEKLETEVREVMAKKSHKLLTLGLGGLASYNILYSVFYLLSNTCSSHEFIMNIGKYIAYDGKIEQEIINEFLVILKSFSSTRVGEKTIVKNDLNGTNRDISNNMFVNPIYHTIKSIYNSNTAFGDMKAPSIAEAAELGIMAVFGESKEHLLFNYFTIHALVMYYWAYRTLDCLRDNVESDTDQSNTGNKLFSKKRSYGKAYKLLVDKNIGIEGFFELVYEDKRLASLAIKYLKACDLRKIGRAEFSLYEEMVDAIEYSTSINTYMAELIDKMTSSYEKNINQYGFDCIVHREIKESDIGFRKAILCCSLSEMRIANVFHEIDGYLPLIYIYKSCKLDSLKMAEINSQLSYVISSRRLLALVLTCTCVSAQTLAIAQKFNDIANELESNNTKLNEANQNAEKLKETIKDLRREIKELKDTIQEKESQIAEYKTKDSLGISVIDIERLKADNERLSGELKKAGKAQIDTDREIAKQQELRKEAGENLKLLQTRYDILYDKYNREVEKDKSVSLHTRLSNIPIECFVNSIKERNIIIIGGDILFNRLKEYKFENLKTISASVSTVKSEEIKGADLVVIVTSHISHSMYYNVSSITKTNNVPTLQYNGSSADNLIYDMFEALNK